MTKTYARLTPLADSLPATVPFVGPETQERARERPFAARLGANENTFGPSPRAIQAMADAARDVWMYGDPENHDLRTALGAFHGVDPSHIIVGEGIDGLLGYLVRLLVGKDDVVVTSQGAYPTFNYHVSGFGGRLEMVPYKDDHEDPQALIEKAAETNAKLVYIANPDNPMGTWHDGVTIQKMIDRVPEGCLLVLDEAYIEFAPDGTAPVLVPDDPRVIRMRTFSKGYGMAGARVGYAIGDRDLITAFHKIRNHFGMCRVSQAGALAALADQSHLSNIVDQVATARARISDIAQENGLTTLQSSTNFVAIDCGADGEFAKAVLDALIEQDIFVRMPFAAPQNRCIRVSAGTLAEMDALAAALPSALQNARESMDKD